MLLKYYHREEPLSIYRSALFPQGFSWARAITDYFKFYLPCMAIILGTMVLLVNWNSIGFPQVTEIQTIIPYFDPTKFTQETIWWLRFVYIVVNTIIHDIGLSLLYVIFYNVFTDGLFKKNVQMRVIALIFNFVGWWWCVPAILPVADDMEIKILLAMNAGCPLIRYIVYDYAGTFAAWGFYSGFLNAASIWMYLTGWYGDYWNTGITGKVITTHGMNFWNDYGILDRFS